MAVEVSLEASGCRGLPWHAHRESLGSGSLSGRCMPSEEVIQRPASWLGPLLPFL